MVVKKVFTWDMITLILFILIAPIIMGKSYFFDTINVIGIYSIAVIGLNLILGLAGIISLGHAFSFGLGAYFSAYISIHFGINPFFSIIISCVLMAFIAFIISFPLLRLSGIYMALGTLAVCVVVYTLINNGGSLTGGPNGFTSIPGFSIGNFSFNSPQSNFYLIWITLFIVYILVKNLMKSREGRALKAIHSDEDAAALFGVDVFRLKMKIFVIGNTLGALAGAYYAHYMSFISPDIASLDNSVNLLSMGFLGGLGSFMGPILGSFVFQVIPVLSSNAKEYEKLIHGVFFLCIVLFFSGGLNVFIEQFISFIKRKRQKKLKT